MAALRPILLTQITTHPLLQVRRRWDPATDPGLATLAQSLAGPEGLIHPVVVAPCPDTAVFGARPWTLVAGHRRLEAARLLGWTTILAQVLPPCDPADPHDRLRLLAIAVRENTERRDLHPTDQREALWHLKELYEAVYPATLTHGRRPGALLTATPEPTPPAFAQWAAEATQIPAWKIRQAFRRAMLGTPTAVSPPALATMPPVSARVEQVATRSQDLSTALHELTTALTAATQGTVPDTHLVAMQEVLQTLQAATNALLTLLAAWPSVAPAQAVLSPPPRRPPDGPSLGV